MKPSTKLSKEAQDNAQSLVDDIKKYHQKVIAAQREGYQEALANAIKCGKALNLAKENIKAVKGKWLDWLKTEIGIPQTTASLYMRLAENEKLLQSEAAKKALDDAASDGNLSIRAASSLLPKRERKASVKDDDEEEEETATDEDEAQETSSKLASVKEISDTVCNSGHTPDDLFNVAVAIIKHVMSTEPSPEQMVAYQDAIAAVWPMKPPLREAA